MVTQPKLENGYHQHDISKLETKSNISPEQYVEINEKQKNKEIISKYYLFGEIERDKLKNNK